MNKVINNDVIIKDLGKVDYQKAWDYQQELFEEIIQIKIQNRSAQETDQQPTPNYLLLCEHPHVYTLGKSGDEKHLLVNNSKLKEIHATYHKTNRGGDITYHGPGQIVGYPILDLENFFTDIHRYMRSLEEAVILTLKDYHVPSGRVDGLTGVWIDIENPIKARKICALGVKTSRWVTMHGFAFNINTDLVYFNNIIPCGITNKAVTSLQNELQMPLSISEVKNKLLIHWAETFNARLV